MARHNFKGSKDPANAITLAIDALHKLLVIKIWKVIYATSVRWTTALRKLGQIMIVVVQKNKIKNASSGNRDYRFT